MKTNAVFMFAGAFLMLTIGWMVSPPAQPLPNVEATVQAAIDKHVAEYHADDLPRIDGEVAAPVLLDPPPDDTIYARSDEFYPATFRWQWDGELKPNMMFEVRIWRDGLDPVSLGAYDVKHVKVISTIAEEEAERRLGTQNLIYYEGNGIYRLPLNPASAEVVDFAHKTYLWSVGVVQVDPYQRLSPEPPAQPINIVMSGFPTPTPIRDR
jgi:hypothetical protein